MNQTTTCQRATSDTGSSGYGDPRLASGSGLANEFQVKSRLGVWVQHPGAIWGSGASADLNPGQDLFVTEFIKSTDESSVSEFSTDD
jgi:hypothetical protein